MLIVDLDDTIFPTKSMPSSLFKVAIDNISSYVLSNTEHNVESLIADLWSRPVDVVCHAYGLPDDVLRRFYLDIEKIDFSRLPIEVYPDYKELLKVPHSRALVTTGLRKLQEAKIVALQIRSDFEEIHIDDPRTAPRYGKKKIFEKIMLERNLGPTDVWIIGDNPDSEIKAGRELGMNTIQRRAMGKRISELSDFVISSFSEVQRIVC